MSRYPANAKSYTVLPSYQADKPLANKPVLQLLGKLHTELLCLDAQAQVDMADAALWLYGIAFEELQRHIAIECRERAQVLACLWEHSSCLTELRCAVQYEGLLAQSRQGFDSLADQRTYLKGQIRYKAGA